MNMSITKRNFLGYLSILTLVGGGLGALVLHYLEPGHYFGGYPLIPVYFYIFGVFYIYMFDACRRHAPEKMVMLFLVAKVLKMIVSVFLLIIYCVAVPDSSYQDKHSGNYVTQLFHISIDIPGVLSGLSYI